MIFVGFPGGPGLRARGWSTVFGCSLGRLAVTKQYGADLQHAEYNLKHAGMKSYEQTSMQNEKNRDQDAAYWKSLAAWWPLYRRASGFSGIFT